MLKYSGPGSEDFCICYDTPITDDVIGHVPDDELQALLDKIEALPKPVDGCPK